MSKVSNNILHNTVQNIFHNNDRILQSQMPSRKNRQSRISKRELELALSVLLVDLAGCDQTFDVQEYNLIQTGMRRVFGTTKTEVTALINQANQTLKNLRGTSRFAAMLKENLEPQERKIIMEVIEDVISADGTEDGFETYLRHKFADLLGVELPTTPSEEQASD